MKHLILILASAIMLTGFGCAAMSEMFLGTDPNVVPPGETAVEGVAAVAPFFGTVGLAVATGLTGALAAWRKVKPGLIAAQTKADQYHAAAAGLTEALEEFKETSPEQWDTLGRIISGQLAKQGIDPLVVENVIRGLRGLPAKA